MISTVVIPDPVFEGEDTIQPSLSEDLGKADENVMKKPYDDIYTPRSLLLSKEGTQRTELCVFRVGMNTQLKILWNNNFLCSKRQHFVFFSLF